MRKRSGFIIAAVAGGLIALASPAYADAPPAGTPDPPCPKTGCLSEGLTNAAEHANPHGYRGLSRAAANQQP